MRLDGKMNWLPVGCYYQLCAKDLLRIGAEGRAAIVLSKKTVLQGFI